MRKQLVRDGVPPRDVFEDHAGFDTWATMVRARSIFGVGDAVVVTQGFHMPRALFLAEEAGIDATGLTADLHHWGYQGRKSEAREVLSRVKAVVDVTLDTPAMAGPRSRSRPPTGAKAGARRRRPDAARRVARPLTLGSPAPGLVGLPPGGSGDPLRSTFVGGERSPCARENPPPQPQDAQVPPPSPTESSAQGPAPPKAPPSEPRPAPARSLRRDRAPQLSQSPRPSDPVVPLTPTAKGTTTGMRGRAPIPWFLSDPYGQRNHERGARSLGGFPRDGNHGPSGAPERGPVSRRETLEALARGALGGACRVRSSGPVPLGGVGCPPGRFATEGGAPRAPAPAPPATTGRVKRVTPPLRTAPVPRAQQPCSALR